MYSRTCLQTASKVTSQCPKPLTKSIILLLETKHANKMIKEKYNESKNKTELITFQKPVQDQ